MGYFFIFLITIVIAYALIVYVIAPISSLLLIISVFLGIGYAFIISILCFVEAIKKNINPYKTFKDSNSDNSNGCLRNYFFGPGYYQVTTIVSEAFKNQKKRVNDLQIWLVGVKKTLANKWFLLIWVLLFNYIAYFCTFAIGFTWMTVFSFVFITLIAIGFLMFYIFFIMIWSFDRLILKIKSIQNRCGTCKRVTNIPIFICPNCGNEHKNLTPGEYGIFYRKCICKEKLPTTFLNGRSKLKSICPYCANEFATSGAQQHSIQLVGTVGSGKTTFLAAFWHEYSKLLNWNKEVSIVVYPEDEFKELERWFNMGISSATVQKNANMYSIIHNSNKKIPVQLNIYDIAGEAFNSFDNVVQQQQFKYCEGIIFVIDPTEKPSVTSETVSTFINEFMGLKGSRVNGLSTVPVVIMITKADIYKRDIGLPKIYSKYKNESISHDDRVEGFNIGFVRNQTCIDFLESRGFGNAINLINASFTNVQYFPTSAMGHPSQPGLKYEPWGILQPVIFLMQYNKFFYDLLKFSEGIHDESPL